MCLTGISSARAAVRDTIAKMATKISASLHQYLVPNVQLDETSNCLPHESHLSLRCDSSWERTLSEPRKRSRSLQKLSSDCRYKMIQPVPHILRNDDLYRMTSTRFLSRLMRSMEFRYKEKSPNRHERVQVGSEPLCFFRCNRSMNPAISLGNESIQRIGSKQGDFN